MLKKAMITSLIFLVAVGGVGCSSKSSNGGDVAPPATTGTTPPPSSGPPTPPPSSDPGPGNGYGTNEVAFYPVSLQEMNSYVATHPLNAPTNFRVKVELTSDGLHRYHGRVNIKYMDNGFQYDGAFESGSSLNPDLDYSPYNGSYGWVEYAYNYWITNTIFSGFFQDQYGAIALVITGTTTVEQGDGQGGEPMLSGEIWYRNFAQSQAPQGPMRKCWFITTGPYNCQSPVMALKLPSSPFPSDTYRKLGTFTGLSRAAAFR